MRLQTRIRSDHSSVFWISQPSYAPLVGQPLSEIPCPCGDHPSYAEHFLEPFLAALDELHVFVEVERADQMYKSGRMTPYVVQALEGREVIARILNECTGKDVGPDWYPFSAICEGCARMDRARVTGFSASAETVDYQCACGGGGTRPMAGGGKLVWRVDWPALPTPFCITTGRSSDRRTTRCCGPLQATCGPCASVAAPRPGKSACRPRCPTPFSRWVAT